MSAIKSIFRGSSKDSQPSSTSEEPGRRASTSATPEHYHPVSHSRFATSLVPSIDVTHVADASPQRRSEDTPDTPRWRNDNTNNLVDEPQSFASSISASAANATNSASSNTNSASLLTGQRSSAMARPTSGQSHSGKSSRRSSRAGKTDDGHARSEVPNRHELMRRAMAAAKDPLFDGSSDDDDDATPIAPASSGHGADYLVNQQDAATAPPRHQFARAASSEDGHYYSREPSSLTAVHSTPSKSSALPAIVTPSPVRAELPRSDSLDDALGPPLGQSSSRRGLDMSPRTEVADLEGMPPVRSKTFNEASHPLSASGPHMTKSMSSYQLDSGQKDRSELVSSPLLRPGPLARLRKNSNDGLGRNAKKSTGGIAGALAASAMTASGVGQAAATPPATLLVEPQGNPENRTGGRSGRSQKQGSQGSVVREPSTQRMAESVGEDDGAFRPPMRPERDRSVSSLVSYDGSVASERSSASGLGAAAGFGAASAALLAPIGATLPAPAGQGQQAGQDSNGQGDGLSVCGSGPSIDNDGWSEDMGPQITGFAVASSKRNKDFHQLFPLVPEDDYLIEDYGCALSREILIHGRLYISENFICFKANIFGWVTNMVVPFSDIVSIEKRMTAFVIPNAIQLATINSKHTFVSFLSRDTTYDLIVNIWRLSHPGLPVTAAEQAAELTAELTDEYTEDEDADGSTAMDKADSVDGGAGKGSPATADSAAKTSKRSRLRRKLKGSKNLVRDDNLAAASAIAAKTGTPLITPTRSPAPGAKRAPHRQTNCPCDDNKEHYPTVALDTTYPAVPEKIYNLLFTSGFTKDFWTDNQKLFELQISDWSPSATNNNMLSRNVSYIKPLTGSFGPKQTKCLLTDENIHVDFDDYVTTLTTTRTPDVPSGGSFSVKTRTCITWAGGGNVSRVLVTCAVEWTGRSMIKGIIDKASIDGQKQYYKDLDEAVRDYLTQHTSEFKEEGDDAAAVEEIARAATPALSQSQKQKARNGSGANGHGDGAGGKASGKAGGGGGGGGQDGGRGGAVSMVVDTVKDAVGMVFDFVSTGVSTVSELLSSSSDATDSGGTSTKMLLLSGIVVLLVLSNLWTWRNSADDTRFAASHHPAYAPYSTRGGYTLPEGYYAPPSPRFYPNHGGGDREQAEHVARAVREVLVDFLRPNPNAGSVGARADREGIHRLITEAEERVERIRNEIEELKKWALKQQQNQQQNQQNQQIKGQHGVEEDQGAKV
ncbi:hypothetical protein ACQY0O_008425 [Thecaphora frezii]